MTQKDFITFASTIAAEAEYLMTSTTAGFDHPGGGGWINRREASGRMITLARIADGYARAAAADNPRFDRGKFAVACHLPASIVLLADVDGGCHGYSADGLTKVKVF